MHTEYGRNSKNKKQNKNKEKTDGKKGLMFLKMI